MGYGNYSLDAHAALTAGRAHLQGSEVFRQTQCHPLMSPKGLKVRECRDSADHPDSLGILFALDVTGSMGQIPQVLAKQELPTLMKLLGQCGVAHPQLLFMAVGDATSDQAPLQIGQFESTAELMDQWLTWSFLEGGGGGTGHESYELALYTAAQHTDTDNWAKRKKKGYLFMTGDELPYPAVSRHQVDSLFSERLDEDIPIEEVIAAALETYHVFFLIPDLKRRRKCEPRWRELLGDHTICMESPSDTCAVAAAIVALTEGRLTSLNAVSATLAEHGFDSDRIGAIVRALTGYSALLHQPPPFSTPQPPRTIGAWWRKLFS